MAKEAPKKSEESKAKEPKVKSPKAKPVVAPATEAVVASAKTEAPGAVAAAPAAPAAPAVPTTAAEALAEGEVAKKVIKAKHSKNVFQGIAHIMATFNNTVVSIGFEGQGNRLVKRGPSRFQRFAQEHGVRGAVGRTGCCATEHGARVEGNRGVGEGAGQRARSGDSCVTSDRVGDHGDQGRDTGPAQRLSAAEASPRVVRRFRYHGTI